MEGMSLKFIPVVVSCLLGSLSMLGRTAGTSLTHSWSKQY